MHYSVAILVLLTIFLYVSVRKILDKNFMAMNNSCEARRRQYQELLLENARLKQENEYLEKNAEEIIALYGITKEIAKYLNTEKIFSVFKNEINKYIKIGDCKFIQGKADLSAYNQYTTLPLNINKNHIGYLIVDKIQEQDTDKFQILAQQFILGIRRALLYQKVQELSITDPLTQALTHRYWLERFKEELERSKKFKYRLACLIVDIDHFKGYNDHYGHLVGDAILRDVSGIIKENIRQIDIVGKYGGDELAIILSETDREGARFAAERMRQAIAAKRVRVYDEDLKVTASIGVSIFPEDASQMQVLFDQADQALYRAKAAGRNQVCVYSDKT